MLGLDGDWQVLDVELVLEEQRVAIRLESVAGAEFCCPECGEKRSLKDHAKQREWRHMDTMQFETVDAGQSAANGLSGVRSRDVCGAVGRSAWAIYADV